MGGIDAQALLDAARSAIEEAGASVGGLGAGLLALASGQLSLASAWDALIATAGRSAMIYFVVFGVAFFDSFPALAQVPVTISTTVTALGLGPWVVLVLILVVYLLLGRVIDSLSMILLTVPICYPVMLTLDFGLTVKQMSIWFGILVLIIVEVGQITPPVGMNLIIINAMDRSTSIERTYGAETWFVATDILRAALLVAFPAAS